MSQSIIVEKSGKAAIIRFNRPAIKNPLSVETLENLEQIFTLLNFDTTVKKIIFTGSGDTFASGANLNEVAALTTETAREFGLRGQNLMRKIYRAEKITFAAIDGFCMGGALDLALSCRRRVASPRSIFAHPGASLGIITGWSGTQILPRLVGKKKAFEIFLTAKKVSAQEALEIGLIDKISADPLQFATA
ncbi:MAG TPA: enoyl-CoA hydratase/isomerase family protein [Pyrinomonadaceae bacterium]|jgi:enoyl-CoA hydratase/carnithine racemase